MSIMEQALMKWRRKRTNVSDHPETNIEAWLAELETVLAEDGLPLSHLGAYLDGDPRRFVENEYAQYEKKTPNA